MKPNDANAGETDSSAKNPQPAEGDFLDAPSLELSDDTFDRTVIIVRSLIKVTAEKTGKD